MLKNTILQMLSEDRGAIVSGGHIAKNAGVTRSAVWKAVKALQEEGYDIETVQGRGYRLSPNSNHLSAEEIRSYLSEDTGLNVLYYRTVGSTNTEAMKLVSQGAPHGTLVVADEQTKGRGRMGRSFYSPVKTGLYMSLVLKSDLSVDKSLLITSAAAVAACRGIMQATGIQPSIKWVNDIYSGPIKIGGILTEAVTDFESGSISHIVVGIGINCTTSAFVDSSSVLSNRAGSLSSACGVSHVNRNHLAAAVSENLMDLYDSLKKNDTSFMDYYREHSAVIGHKVKIYRRPGDTEYTEAVASDIDSGGGLVVIYPDGTSETLRTGEISVRLSQTS